MVIFLHWKKRLTTLAVLSGLAIGTMHIMNKIVNYLSNKDDKLYNENSLYYEWRFGRICYHKYGKGSPILLIHDLNVCSSSAEWNKIVSDLAKTNTVYTLDLLGCGCSDKPHFTYTNYLYVQLITNFIKHVISEKTDVITVGRSCSFVLMACANNNSIINRVILINPNDLVDLAKIPTKQTKMLQQLIELPILGTFLYNMLINKKTIEKSLRSHYFYNEELVDEHLVSTCFESSHRDKTSGKYLFASIKSRYTNANTLYALNHIDNSIFIIVGNNNPEFELIADQYQNYMPSIEIIGIDHTKYLPHIEMPEKFVEQVEILFDINNSEELST